MRRLDFGDGVWGKGQLPFTPLSATVVSGGTLLMRYKKSDFCGLLNAGANQYILFRPIFVTRE